MYTDCKITDIHTHIFPPNIAESTINLLKDNILRESGVRAETYTDATESGLRLSMEKSGVALSVVLPVLTNPKSFDSVNSFAKKLNDISSGIISFAGIHPLSDDISGSLEKIKEMGFKGIKLHPEFQSFFIDSKEGIAVLKEAERLGLYTVIHCGIDLGMPKPVHCAPKALSNVLSEVSGRFIIAAHLGGLFMFDDVLKYLAGTDIMLDTAYVCGNVPPDTIKEIIKAHGSEKVLFGSDSPWGSQSVSVECIKSLNLPKADYENIMYRNAARILSP